MEPVKIRELENRLGHKFKDRKKLYRALTHSTFSKEEKERRSGQKIARIRKLMPPWVMQF